MLNLIIKILKNLIRIIKEIDLKLIIDKSKISFKSYKEHIHLFFKKEIQYIFDDYNYISTEIKTYINSWTEEDILAKLEEWKTYINYLKNKDIIVELQTYILKFITKLTNNYLYWKNMTHQHFITFVLDWLILTIISSILTLLFVYVFMKLNLYSLCERIVFCTIISVILSEFKNEIRVYQFAIFILCLYQYLGFFG